MDGTLLNSNMNISKRNLQAIQKLREKGIIFTIATGRAYQLVKEYIDELGLQDDYLILNNGGVIGNPRIEECLLENIVPKDVSDYVIDYCEEHNSIYMVYTKEAIFTKPNFRAQFFIDRNDQLEEHRKSTFVYLDNMLEVKDHPKINKILIVEPDDSKYLPLKNVMLQIQNATVMSSQTTFVDINPPHTSKGHALEVLARYHNVDITEVMAFGDQENDLEMIQTAGIGIAMGNAREDLKEIANDIADTNNNDGFAKWIEENILK